MRRTWTAMPAVMALFLFGGLPAGTQSLAPGPTSAAVTGTATCTVTTPGTEPDQPPPYQVSGAVLTCTETASDPRVTGTSTIVLDTQVFDGTAPSAGVGWGDFALAGPEGTWTGRHYVIGEASGAQRTTTVAVGDGAYAGWAYARSATHEADGTVDFTGVVYLGDPPPEFPVTALTGLLPGDDPGQLPPAEEATPAMTGTLELGKGKGKPTKATIGADGGTIATTKRGDPLAGLTITVPAGAFAADTPFTVSAKPISGHDFGPLLTPLTPLYTVETGGATLAMPATVELSLAVSADAPASAVAMAFYHDPDTGMLSPLTTISSDGTHLVALAPHFSSFFGGLLDMAGIPTFVDSGFRPGTDDWQFRNHGSYIAPGGHCEGQVLSELWYYVHQRRAAGASPLYGLYDNNGAGRTPTLWEDDSDGYRLASVVQKEPFADERVFGYFSGWDSATRTFTKTSSDAQTYDLFRAAIALTGQPQEIGISPTDGKGGHAMLVYKVTPHWLLIADPNYPGVGRRIRYDRVAGKLGPFISGNNAEDIAAGMSKVYTRFVLIPSQVREADATIADHWAEFEAGTIGDGTFPGYTLEASTAKDASGNAAWVPLTDGLTTDEAQITVRIGKLTDGTWGNIAVFRDDVRLVPDRTFLSQTFDLVPGENRLGIQVVGNKSGWSKYVDFVRLTVTSTAPPAGKAYTLRPRFGPGCDTANGPYDGRINRLPVYIDGSTATMAHAKDTGSKHLVVSGSGTYDPKTGILTLPDVSATFTRDLEGGVPGTEVLSLSVRGTVEDDPAIDGERVTLEATGSVVVDYPQVYDNPATEHHCSADVTEARLDEGFVDTDL